MPSAIDGESGAGWSPESAKILHDAAAQEKCKIRRVSDGIAERTLLTIETVFPTVESHGVLSVRGQPKLQPFA